MLADKDRIFTNLYGFHDWRLAAARARGAGDAGQKSCQCDDLPWCDLHGISFTNTDRKARPKADTARPNHSSTNPTRKMSAIVGSAVVMSVQ